MTRHLLKASLITPLLFAGVILPAASQDRSPNRMMMDGFRTNIPI